MQELKNKLQENLKQHFNFSSFRPGQEEAITTLMTHGRLLCIQPTGHGKSLLYQLPATILEGITLVISPLLALMRDQLTQLKNRFNIPAASINTDQTDEENYGARQAARTGKIKILFIAPEQLDHLERFQFLLDLPIKLLVVDEAHCISTWGHDFRPSYRQIIQLAHALVKNNSTIRLLALTATANEKTEADIKQQLSVDTTPIVVHRESMNRPNIRLTVIRCTGTAKKLAVLPQLLSMLQGAGLIYCATRENTQLVAEYLTAQGVATTAYHAGIASQEKIIIQHDFIHDKYTVISATNALGMGIDKSNLRYIIHFDFPGSITAYYQEVGRAGRDGYHADGILLYDSHDAKVQKYFIDSAQPSSTDFQLVINTLLAIKIPQNLSALKRLTGLHPTRLTVIIAELVEQGFLIKTSQNRAQVYSLAQKNGKPDLARYSIQLKIRNDELTSMQRYAEQSKKCLMKILRLALGDKQSQDCGQCSICSEPQFKPNNNKDTMITITSWLERRTVPITLSKKIKNIASGIAVMDGKLRSPLFIHFMQERTHEHFTFPDTLKNLIYECFNDLQQHYQFAGIVAPPSRTWGARERILREFSSYLKIPLLADLLQWHEMPAARQGELLNNDQRQHNVSNRMKADSSYKLSSGSILLVDDYTGSGATLDEAARALREHFNHEIIPFTIAAVKWRLGKKGMV